MRRAEKLAPWPLGELQGGVGSPLPALRPLWATWRGCVCAACPLAAPAGPPVSSLQMSKVWNDLQPKLRLPLRGTTQRPSPPRPPGRPICSLVLEGSEEQLGALTKASFRTVCPCLIPLVGARPHPEARVSGCSPVEGRQPGRLQGLRSR